MTPLFKTLMESIGKSKVPRYARESFGYRATVLATSDFDRVKKIPRRRWDDSAYLADVSEILQGELAAPEGSMDLWDIQSAALADIVLAQGGFFPIGVGRGKALISLLACVVLKAQRPILFVPAALREQSLLHVIPEMEKHWKLSSNLRVIGYSELSLAKNADMLKTIQPDLIIMDECHNLKNVRAGRTRRMSRYMRMMPATTCIGLSGTVSKRSIKDFAHIIRWCLKENAPVPSQWAELCEWADAIDEKVPDEQKVHPGALMQFCEEGENVRQGFQRRLGETPGVVASKDNELGVSLSIQRQKHKIPREINTLINDVRRDWERPDGEIMSEATDLHRHIRTLALGFWHRWDPAPPDEWMDARREWKSFVRETLKNNRRGLDTELQVWNECAAVPGHIGEWDAWRDIKDTFKPHSIAVWESRFAIRECGRWLDRNDSGIIWVEAPVFGEELSEAFGIPYYGGGDSRILTTTIPQIIASRASHGEGKNLQRYSNNLVVSPSTSGSTWEQMLGRTHREGQQADRVKCDVFMEVRELQDAFAQAREDAKYLQDTFGNVQKLNYADIVV